MRNKQFVRMAGYEVNHSLINFIQGGLFHGDDDISQIAFKYAVERINSRSIQYQFVPMIFNISRTDSFKVQQAGKKIFKERFDIQAVIT